MTSGERYFQKRIEFLDKLKEYKSNGSLTMSEIDSIKNDMGISKTLMNNLLREFQQYKIIISQNCEFEIILENIFDVPQYKELLLVIDLLCNNRELMNKNVVSETDLAQQLNIERKVIQRAKTIIISIENNF